MKELIVKAKELFELKIIEVLLGWKYDEIISDVRPYLFKDISEIDELIYDRRSVHNLTNYLPNITKRYKKVGIVLKGCDGRSLTTQIVEHRINLNQIVALAVGCEGVDIDEKQAPKCDDCPTNISPIADYVFGEKKTATEPGYDQLKKIEAMTDPERWDFFAVEFDKCTRCYACRQICPLCYCELCIADQHEPKWIEASAKLSSNTMWHLTRAYHLAGRCSDCGECDRICPEDIPLRLLNNAVEKSVLEMFNVRAGTIPDELPPLVVLAKEDPDEILGGRHE
ncbi:MAG: 4Fe-4S dicluster domain-containing protein [Candidatus Stygibacter australis]|nr:4Fe-4S dicluster domain-containing protein [Candidatus Stygibacter australis]MDP8321820.1 4Fe-4S dicluster domain-containing protein [Candidatus Stygibacter australis]